MPLEPPPIRRILVPTKFSELSTHAAQYARRIAPAVGADVHVLHVVEPPIPAVDPAGPTVSVGSLSGPAELMSAGRDGVDRFIREHLPGLATPAHGVVTMGIAQREIVEYAGLHHVDLIIMGTQGRGVLGRIVFGSVSKSVLESAPCPVLLVPLGAMAHARDATP